MQGPGQRGRPLAGREPAAFASTRSPAAPRSASSCSATSACGRSRSSSAASPATIVCEDADLDRAAPRCAQFRVPPRRAGLHVDAAPVRASQRSSSRFSSCSSRRPRELKVGDPARSRRPSIGPMISEREAARAEQWVQRGGRAGRARRRAAAQRRGALLQPTILDRRRAATCG